MKSCVLIFGFDQELFPRWMLRPDVRHHWTETGRRRLPPKNQPSLFRSPSRLLGIHFFTRENAILPRGPAAAADRDHVIDVGLLSSQLLAGVLAGGVITLEDPRGGELRRAHGHLVEAGQNNYRRHADFSSDGFKRVVALTHRQKNPFVPFDGNDVVFGDVERSDLPGEHLAQDFDRSADVDGLPVLVQNQHLRI